MAFGCRRPVCRLPFFGAFQIGRNLLFELVVADLRGNGNGAAPAFAPNFKRETLATGQRTQVLVAMTLDIRGARRREVSVVEPHGRAVRVEIDDDSVGDVAHGPDEGPAGTTGCGETKISASFGRTSRRRS